MLVLHEKAASLSIISLGKRTEPYSAESHSTRPRQVGDSSLLNLAPTKMKVSVETQTEIPIKKNQLSIFKKPGNVG